VRAAVRSFHADPERARGNTARIIFQYAEQSRDVQLVMNSKVMSFIKNQKKNFDERSTLLLAFIVGDMEAQWARRETKDNSYAGVLQVIATYQQLKKSNPNLRIPEIENFIEMQRRGELKAYVSG
jgi:hypothetical protein